MSDSLFLIFNHTFTDSQCEDAVLSLSVGRIVDMPSPFKVIWGSIPPDLDRIYDYLEPLQTWLRKYAEPGDYVLIQGDFGACYIMVNYAFSLGLIPIYSTTGREAVESVLDDGTVKVTHNFRHTLFRRYER